MHKVCKKCAKHILSSRAMFVDLIIICIIQTIMSVGVEGGS